MNLMEVEIYCEDCRKKTRHELTKGPACTCVVCGKETLMTEADREAIRRVADAKKPPY
jgi:hypothetical protein